MVNEPGNAGKLVSELLLQIMCSKLFGNEGKALNWENSQVRYFNEAGKTGKTVSML